MSYNALYIMFLERLGATARWNLYLSLLPWLSTLNSIGSVGMGWFILVLHDLGLLSWRDTVRHILYVEQLRHTLKNIKAITFCTESSHDTSNILHQGLFNIWGPWSDKQATHVICVLIEC